MRTVPATTFRPSLHGCRFGNADTRRLPVTLGPVPVARVGEGLCGGMVLDSLRAWREGRPPAGRSSADLTRVFGAQLRSFQIPTAPWKYLRLQRPRALNARRRANQRALTQITDHLGRDTPVPVALVCRLSNNPLALTAHHVVLVYRVAACETGSTTFGVYDPNRPGDDGVLLRITPSQIRHSHRRDVHAAFVLDVH